MSITWTEDEIMALRATLVERFETDPAFQARALADTPAVLRELAGRDLPPETAKLRVVQADGGFAIKIVEPMGELSDDDLDAVVGGAGNVLGTTMVVGALVGGALFGQQAYASGGSARQVAHATANGVVSGALAGVVVGVAYETQRRP